MDEEKNNEQAQGAKNVLTKGAKKLSKQTAKKFFKKIIAVILPLLLKAICIGLLIYLLVASISHFLDWWDSSESKEANRSSIVFSTGTIKPDDIKATQITVNADYMTTDKAYELQYSFVDEKKNEISESQAINNTKKKLVEENEKINLGKFSTSELKTLGVLMSNGLETGKYNEEELKALAVFVKADIASQSLDLGNSTGEKNIKIEDVINNDEVYGTIEVHKTTATTTDGSTPIYQEIKLEYVPYETFKNMVESLNNDVLTKYTLNEDGNIVIAKPSTTKITYTYQDENGNPLSDADKARIGEENIADDVDEYIIKEYPIEIDYKQYIKKYIVNYGFLTDLLITTNNVDFCLDIAELAFNSKIVLNIREEQVDTETHAPTHYTETSLFYDHVKYKIDGYKKTTTWTKIGKGTGKPPKNIDEDEQITYSGDEWTLSRGTTTTSHVASESNSDKDGDLIANEHLTESYDDYSVDETYTRQEVFNYTIIVDSSTRNYKYDIDISEIDCWYLLYDRPYAAPTKNIKEYDKPDDVEGQYPQTTSPVEGVSAGASNAANAFLEKKKNQFANSYPEANVIEGSITAIRTEKKSKTDGVVGDDYKATRTTYEFGDESSIDTTQVQFKNLEYLNNKPSYTPNGKMGLLYIYDKYIKAGEDLCLQNDAEKELFELLEDDANTTHISDIMRFLLYVYDGLERGVTDLDKTFKVVDMSLTDYYSIAGNAFGCNISRDEFITKAQSYGKSILADLAPLFYDICSKYNVNPCVAYGWAALESGWGKSAVEDKNLFQMGSYNGSSSGFSYDSYEDSIESFCKWVVNAADPSSSAYSQNQERAKEYATVNSKFDGTPDKNIYALFSRYSWVGYTHTGNARACIKNTYNFLNNGVYECNHADSDETTLKERADYMQYQVDLRLSIAEDVFKTKILLSNKGDFTSIDNIIIGISNDDESQFSGGYSSSFGRKYIEWIQGAGLIGQQPLFDSGATMGSAGCHVYACGTLASSTGIEPSIWEVWDIYKHKAGNEAYVRTIEMVLDLYGVDAKVCTGNAWNQEDVISVLKSGKGVMIYVKNGYGNLYTKKVHWITLADIRETQLNSGIGYDIYALTSNNGRGHGWHPIETVLKNLAGPNFFYIEDGKIPNKVKKGDTYEEF